MAESRIGRSVFEKEKKKPYRADQFFISEVRRGQKITLAEALPHRHKRSGENVSLYPIPNKKIFLLVLFYKMLQLPSSSKTSFHIRILLFCFFSIVCSLSLNYNESKNIPKRLEAGI